jgi:hypothetical protein
MTPEQVKSLALEYAMEECRNVTGSDEVFEKSVKVRNNV